MTAGKKRNKKEREGKRGVRLRPRLRSPFYTDDPQHPSLTPREGEPPRARSPGRVWGLLGPAGPSRHGGVDTGPGVRGWVTLRADRVPALCPRGDLDVGAGLLRPTRIALRSRKGDGGPTGSGAMKP